MMRQSRLHQMTDFVIAILNFREIRIDISCELSAKQTINMKYQALFFKKISKI